MLLVYVKDNAYVRHIFAVDEEYIDKTKETEVAVRDYLLSKGEMQPHEKIVVVPLTVKTRRNS